MTKFTNNLSNFKNRLLNLSEERTYKEIISNESLNERNVFTKVRVADVLNIDSLSNEYHLFSYALKAHFDFTICNDNFEPLFVIEFDGPSHMSPTQSKRDEMKMEICSRLNLPILRINNKYLDNNYRGKLTLLTWIIDVFFMEIAFNEAQSRGEIPYDEPFDPMWIITNNKGIKKLFPYQLAIDARTNLQHLQKKGLIKDFAANSAIGVDKKNIMRGFSFIRVKEDRCIWVKSAMRNYNGPIYLGDLFDELLFLSLDDALKKYFHTGKGTISLKEAQEMATEMSRHVQFGRSSSVNGLNPVSFSKFK